MTTKADLTNMAHDLMRDIHRWCYDDQIEPPFGIDDLEDSAVLQEYPHEVIRYEMLRRDLLRLVKKYWED